MRTRCLSLLAAALLGCLAGVVAYAVAGDVSLLLSADPIAVERGGSLTYELTIENDGAGTIQNGTLYAPLPGGLDQWGAEVRIEGGPWSAYPPNGLLALDPLGPGETRDVVIRADVELGAPASLPTTAEVLDPSGPRATGFTYVNVLPSVDAGPDLIAEYGGSVKLSAASAGDGGDPLTTIEWSDQGAGGSFDDPDVLQTIYAPPAVSGVVELTLRAVDQDGGMSSDSLRVRVNAPPTADAGPDQTFVIGDDVDLTEADATDVDGWIVAYAWSDGGAGGSFEPSADILNPVYTPPAIDPCAGGGVELTLTVTDDWGGVASDSALLSSESANRPPTVDAGEDLAVESEIAVRLGGRATDPDGDVLDLQWTQTGGPSVRLDGERTQTLEFLSPSVEEDVILTFELRATDGCGSVAHDEVAVEVLAPSAIGIDVSIRAFDPWGFPLSSLDTPPNGQPITIEVEIVNTGACRLTSLSGIGVPGGAFAFVADALDPWERARASFTYTPDPQQDGDRLEIEVSIEAISPHGETITGSDEIAFLLEQDERPLLLEKSVNRTEAAVGETVVYTYTIRNAGETSISDLILVDDRLGPIDVPEDTLAPGEALRIDVPYTIRETDFPGPLTNTALLDGFAESGMSTEAAADVSIGLLETTAGAGGGMMPIPRSILISEVAWAGSASSADAEWIELANLSGESIDLTGWSLRFDDAAGNRRSILLAGVLEPLATEGSARLAGTERLSALPHDGGWRIVDLGWSSPENGTKAQGYYLLERGGESTVEGVNADLIYDPGFTDGLALPDRGTALSLHAPDGTLIDTANATRGAWPAGDAQTRGTMERVNLLRADSADNWQTSSGIFTHGTDIVGSPLVGTAGMPNSLSLETLTAFAATAVNPIILDAPISIPLPAGSRLQLSLAGAPGSAGGGGFVPSANVSTRTTSSGRWIDLDPTGWFDGLLCVWVALRDGETLVFPVAPGP